MSGYSVQHNPQWKQSARHSTAPSMSVYSVDEDGERMDDDLSSVPPLQVQRSTDAPYHAHPNQQITDPGPQARPSKIPVFQQVRSMLRKPQTSVHSAPLRYDEFSGNPSETGKEAYMKASAYKIPEKDVIRSRRRSSDLRSKSVRSVSPVSLLRADEMGHLSPISHDGSYPRPQSPASPVSPVSPPLASANDGSEPFPAFSHSQSRSLPQEPAQIQHVKMPKRKPVVQTIPENTPPPDLQSRPESPRDGVETTPELSASRRDPESHFSWTTYAPSVRGPSLDLRNSTRVSYGTAQRQSDLMASRFSWSTVATGMTHASRPDSPPPSPPPPVPAKFKQPPMQSILSRHRPISRHSRDDDDDDNNTWTPPPPPKNRPVALDLRTTPMMTTPTSAQRRNLTVPNNNGGSNSGKKLPLPPELASPATPLSHVEALLKQEEDIIHQRKNIERLITEDTKIEKASPIDVSFAAVKDAKKRLEEHRIMLAEVLLEEREIGILISRARRRDGEEDGLWVRRVTG